MTLVPIRFGCHVRRCRRSVEVIVKDRGVDQDHLVLVGLLHECEVMSATVRTLTMSRRPL